MRISESWARGVKGSLLIVLLGMLLVSRNSRGATFCGTPTPGCPGGSCAEPGPPLPPCGCDGNCNKSPCYVATGAYVASADDLSLPSAAGLPLSMSRNYQSTRLIDG